MVAECEDKVPDWILAALSDAETRIVSATTVRDPFSSPLTSRGVQDMTEATFRTLMAMEVWTRVPHVPLIFRLTTFDIETVETLRCSYPLYTVHDGGGACIVGG